MDELSISIEASHLKSTYNYSTFLLEAIYQQSLCDFHSSPAKFTPSQELSL